MSNFFTVLMKSTSAVKTLKLGRNKQQKKCIDFLCGEGGCLSAGGMKFKDYENIIVEKLNSKNWKQYALEKLGIDESQVNEVRDIEFSNYDFNNDLALILEYTPGKYISSHYEFGFVFCSDTHLYLWKKMFSTINDEDIEITRIFALADITAFSTEDKVKEKLKFKKRCIRVNFFYVTTNISTFKVTVPNDFFEISYQTSPEITEHINGIRAKLYDVKCSK